MSSLTIQCANSREVNKGKPSCALLWWITASGFTCVLWQSCCCYCNICNVTSSFLKHIFYVACRSCGCSELYHSPLIYYIIYYILLCFSSWFQCVYITVQILINSIYKKSTGYKSSFLAHQLSCYTIAMCSKHVLLYYPSCLGHILQSWVILVTLKNVNVAEMLSKYVR